MFTNRLFHQYQETILTESRGVFRRRISFFEGVALVGTLGAGILGIPYAVARVGVALGTVYIIALGLLMMGLNLLMGEIMIRTGRHRQLAGLARVYLGRYGGWLMIAVNYSLLIGALLVYIIGVGETLSALLGGSARLWSTGFFLLGSLCVGVGIQTVKRAEILLLLGALSVIIFIVAISSPQVEFLNFTYINLAQALFPYGVILFALSGVNNIPEVYSLLGRNETLFKRVITVAGLQTVFVYLIFTLVIVGVTGAATTQIATLGLGQKVGPVVLFLGGLFAILAMSTSFLMVGLSLKDSLRWDFKVPNWLAVTIVCGLPFALFQLGLRSFIATIDFVGGVFISTETLLVLLIYWRAKQKGDMPVGKYKLHHTTLLLILIPIAMAVGAVYSVVKLF